MKPESQMRRGLPTRTLFEMLLCGHLVYARGNVDAIRHVVGQAGIEIICCALDLALPPAKLLEQVRDLAGELVSGSPTV